MNHRFNSYGITLDPVKMRFIARTPHQNLFVDIRCPIHKPGLLTLNTVTLYKSSKRVHENDEIPISESARKIPVITTNDQSSIPASTSFSTGTHGSNVEGGRFTSYTNQHNAST